MPLNFKILLFCLLVEIITADSDSYALKTEAMCAKYMKFKYGPSKDWKCSLFADPTQVTHLKTLSSNNSSSKQSLKCLCTYHYECLDTEEFVLDSELFNVSKSMKKEFYLQKNFYTELCEQGLFKLTNVSYWNCLLNYDPFDLDEHYCNCTRVQKCQIDKVLKIKS